MLGLSAPGPGQERRPVAADAAPAIEPGRRPEPDRRADPAHPGRAGLAVPAEPGRRQRPRHRGARHAGVGAVAPGRPRHRRRHRRRRGRSTSWFDQVLKHRTGARRTASRSPWQGGGISIANGRPVSQLLTAQAGYPGVNGSVAQHTDVTVTGARTADRRAGRRQPGRHLQPAWAVERAQRGVGTSLFSSLTNLPGQVAGFTSAPLSRRLRITGASTVTLDVTPRTSTDATLFVSLQDVAPDGSTTLPAQLVAPVSLVGLRAGHTQRVHVALPDVVYDMTPGTGSGSPSAPPIRPTRCQPIRGRTRSRWPVGSGWCWSAGAEAAGAGRRFWRGGRRLVLARLVWADRFVGGGHRRGRRGSPDRSRGMAGHGRTGGARRDRCGHDAARGRSRTRTSADSAPCQALTCR